MQATEPVLLITGDSGVGKSALLAEILDEGRARGRVATLAARLQFRPGALQQALLEQLADVTASLVSEISMVQRAGQLIVAAAKQVARDRGHELAIAMGKEMLSIVRARLGDDVGNALGDFIRALAAQEEQSLLARLRAAADPDALLTLVSFAAEVAALADGAEVVLGVDDADRLSDPDLRQLADLVNMLPEHVLVCAAHLSATAAQHERIRLLREAGARELPVTGLDERAVGPWLAAEQFDARIAARVQRLTGGYPLFIDDVLAVLARGGTLGDVTPSERFASNTQDALRQLDLGTARAARMLAAYADPPPQDRLLAVVGVDEFGWAEMSERLVRSRLFATTVGRRPWFHELRRRAVWNALNSAERASAADWALADLLDRYDQTGDPEALVSVALIAADSEQAHGDPMALYALTASPEEVAVAAAVLEIAEGVGAGPHPEAPLVMGDSLLVYTRETFLSDGDLLTALRNLADHGLVTVISNEFASVVFPCFTKLAAILMAGRAGAELGRLPIPRLAGSVFRTVVGLRLGQFQVARYGLGTKTIADLSAELPNVRRSPDTFVVVPAQRLPAVLVRGLVAGQSFYLAATFADTAQREQAAARLTGVTEPFLDDRVIITDVVQHPQSRVPARRFLNAVSQILSVPIHPEFPRLQAENPVEFAEAVQRRADTLRLVRALCSQIERYALGLEEPIRLAFANRGDSSVVAEIFGGEDGTIKLDRFPVLSMFGDDPYERYVLREQLGLSWTQRVGRIEGHTGEPSSADPVLESLAALSKKAKMFNSHQPRLDLPLEAQLLQALLEEAGQRCFNDATALSALTFTVSIHPPQPTATLVAVCPDIPEYGWIPGAHALAGIAVLDSAVDTNAVQVYVSAATTRPDYEQVRQAFREGFAFELPAHGPSGPVPEQHLIYSTYGPADSVLARLLGHRRDDIRILLSGTVPAT